MLVKFTVPMLESEPDLPPMDSEDSYHITYLENDQRKGGFSIASDIIDNRVEVIIDTTQEVVDQMLLNSNYTLIEVIEND